MLLLLKVLEEQVSRLQGGSPSSTYTHPDSAQAMPIYDVCGSSVQDNQSYLKQMTFQQVGVTSAAIMYNYRLCQVEVLLEAMDLHKYKDIFRMERITGDVLVELSEQDLKEELKIESKLHRYIQVLY